MPAFAGVVAGWIGHLDVADHPVDAVAREGATAAHSPHGPLRLQAPERPALHTPARAFPSSIFLDENRRGIGEFQSIWTDSKMETAGSLGFRRLFGAGAGRGRDVIGYIGGGRRRLRRAIHNRSGEEQRGGEDRPHRKLGDGLVKRHCPCEHITR
jgi:hypothetical protein